MARTSVKAEPESQGQPPGAASVTESAARAATATSSRTAQKAYELTDTHGCRAYVWWENGAPVVEADAPDFGRRVQRALKKPIWSREDELDEFGMRSDRFVLLGPDDPRYPSRLLWRWDQLRIRDLESVDVVTLPDRQSVRRYSPLDQAVSQRMGKPTPSSVDRA